MRPAAANGTSVASKVFAVLDAFRGVETSLRLTEIAERAHLTLPTALRIVRELVAWGGLERHGDGSYRVGQRMWTLGAVSPCVRLLRETGAPHLRALHTASGQHVQLAVRDGIDALCLDLVNGTTPWAIRTRIGGRLPLYATGVGKVLLAHAPDGVLDRVLAAGLRRFTPYTTNAPGRLGQELEKVRIDGIAFVHEELQLGSASVAAGVLDAADHAVAAIGIVAPTHIDTTRFAPMVRGAAAAMSRDLVRRVAARP